MNELLLNPKPDHREFNIGAFTRLAWKEYRQNRALWLAFLIFGAAVQLIIRFASELSQKDSAAPSNQLMAAVWLISPYVTLFYLTGSTAMMFAMEREERTREWLMLLPLPRWSLLAAKYSVVVVAAFVLILALTLSAAVVSIGTGLPIELTSHSQSGSVSLQSTMRTIGFVASMILMFGSGFILWSTLGSLTSPRVIVAPFFAIGWWLLLFLIPMTLAMHAVEFLYGSRPGVHEGSELVQWAVFVLSYLATLILNIVLGLRWSRGKDLDFSKLDELHDRWMTRLALKRFNSHRVLPVTESEYSERRMWQRLIWQERHRETLHQSILQLLIGLSGVLALFCRVWNGPITTFVMLLLIVPLPMVMGLLGFRSESDRSSLQFLSHHGAFPGRVWMAKHAVWLPRAFWIPIVCFGVAYGFETLLIPQSGLWHDQQLSIEISRHPLTAATNSFRNNITDLCWFILLSYGLGHVAAMLLRRTVLAVGSAFILFGLLSGWYMLVSDWNLPRWWAFGGVAIWVFLFGARYSRHWISGHSAASVGKQLTLGIAAPVLLLFISTVMYRWLEVPGIGPSSTSIMAIMYPTELKRRREIFGYDHPVAIAHFRESVKNSMLATRHVDLASSTRIAEQLARVKLKSSLEDSAEFLATLPPDASSEMRDSHLNKRFWEINREPLQAITRIANEATLSSNGRISLPKETSLMALKDSVRSISKLGDPKDVAEILLTSLRLLRNSSIDRDADHLLTVANLHFTTLQSLVDWSNRTDVSRDLLIDTIRRTQVEIDLFPSASDLCINDFVRVFNRTNDQTGEEAGSPGMTLSVIVRNTLLAHEIARGQRLAEYNYFWKWNELRHIEQMANGQGIDATIGYTDWLLGLERTHPEYMATRTSHLGIDFLQGESFVTEFARLPGVLNSEAIQRQSLLAMTLVLCRKDHDGGWPSKLDDLARYCLIPTSTDHERVISVMNLNDPWTGAEFVYHSPLPTDSSDNDVKASLYTVTRSSPRGHIQNAALAVSDTEPNSIRHHPSDNGMTAIQCVNGNIKLMIPIRLGN